MFSQTFRLSNYSRQNLFIWWSLAFQAGLINIGGFMACHRFVTHTTGFATFFGAELAQLHFGTALGMLMVPLFFLLGAMYSAFFIDRKITIGKTPQYQLVIGTMTLILFFVSISGVAGLYGEFGSPLDITKDFTLLALLCLASGIQNASVTSASGAVLRTTHLTGMTTDLGIGLISVFSQKNQELNLIEQRKNNIRIGLMTSFILGSMIGAFMFSNFRYGGFFLPALTSLSLYILARRHKISQAPEGEKS
jgi:uncharacterized membrane protein YoaK (UPF0700 family)